MDATTLLPVLAILFVFWTVAAYRLRHEARQRGVFEIWKVVIKVIVLLLLLTFGFAALQYLVVGEYWTG